MSKVKTMSDYIAFFRLLAKYIQLNDLTDFNKEESNALDEQIKQDAAKFVDALEDLGPTYIKLGQLLSSRKTLFPKEFILALDRLQDNVKPLDFSTIKNIVETELKCNIKKVFSDFKEEPISTASLGQVHKATLITGEEVVVKVQKPDVAEIIKNDLKTLGRSLEILNAISERFKRYHIEGILEDFKDNIKRELNYQEEANNIEVFTENLKTFESIVLPKVYKSYCTHKIITMDFVPGEKVSQVSGVGQTEYDGVKILKSVFRAYLKQILVDGFIHSDPHLGNLLLIKPDKIGIIDLGMVTKIGPSTQVDFQHLLLAMSEGKASESADIALRMTSPLKDTEVDIDEFKQKIYKLVKDQQGRHLKDMKIGESLIFITDIAATSGLYFPSEFSSLGRTLMYLDHLATYLDKNFNPYKELNETILSFIRQSEAKKFSFNDMVNHGLEMKHLIEKMPYKVNTLLEDIINRRLQIKIDAFNEDNLIQGFEKVANRIATGLVLAALIMGATKMMTVPSHFTLFGYPGLAMLLFILAFLGSTILLINVLIRDR
ncbi:MAG: hypothetical protein CME62_06715 [Halobacteriovoraceae bacterium]|nr:hypothetical protein [Halobacteriovoraceae bacterium]|tara:strand:- start:12598 stop:14235 length:1638 start_codon:yes stop_codon:yes gene_type:complete